MLTPQLKQQLQAYSQYIKQPVEIVSYLNDSDKSQELNTLIQELDSISDKVQIIQDRDSATRRPSMAIRAKGSNNHVQFAGIPAGHEFTSLVLALLHAGGHQMKLEDATKDQIRSLDQELNFEVFISLSCQNCPDVVQALNMMATLNPNVRATMIDGAIFEEEVKDRNIMAVPSVYLNGEPFSQGRMTLKDILAKVDQSGNQRAAEALSAKAPFDTLIVGGGPAGASAAVYAARKGIRTGVVADRFGGQVADTVGIENFISVKETTGPQLVAQLENHVKDYDVDVMDGLRVNALEKQADGTVSVTLDNDATLSARSVVIATGARWRELGVPGEQEYRGKGVAYCPHCDGLLFKGKKVIVVGGGNSGIEAAIDLSGIAAQVTVLEFSDTLRADKVLVERAERTGNIQIIKQAATTEVVGNGAKVTGLRYQDRVSGEEAHLDVDGIFVQIGLVPNTDFAKDTLEMSRFGEIATDAHGQTSVPGVFAAGDCTQTPYKQIIIAMGDGANAALGAFDYLIRQPSSVSEVAKAA